MKFYRRSVTWLWGFASRRGKPRRSFPEHPAPGRSTGPSHFSGSCPRSGRGGSPPDRGSGCKTPIRPSYSPAFRPGTFLIGIAFLLSPSAYGDFRFWGSILAFLSPKCIRQAVLPHSLSKDCQEQLHRFWDIRIARMVPFPETREVLRAQLEAFFEAEKNSFEQEILAEKWRKDLVQLDCSLAPEDLLKLKNLEREIFERKKLGEEAQWTSEGAFRDFSPDDHLALTEYWRWFLLAFGDHRLIHDLYHFGYEGRDIHRFRITDRKAVIRAAEKIYHQVRMRINFSWAWKTYLPQDSGPLTYGEWVYFKKRKKFDELCTLAQDTQPNWQPQSTEELIQSLSRHLSKNSSADQFRAYLNSKEFQFTLDRLSSLTNEMVDLFGIQKMIYNFTLTARMISHRFLKEACADVTLPISVYILVRMANSELLSRISILNKFPDVPLSQGWDYYAITMIIAAKGARLTLSEHRY